MELLRYQNGKTAYHSHGDIDQETATPRACRSPPLTSSRVSASLVLGHPSHPENMGVIRIGLSSLFGVTRKPLRCLWTRFHYSLWSYIPDPLHHMDNNTSICTTQASHLGLQSQVWLSIQQPLQPPVTCLCIALCVMKPNGLPAVFSVPPPQLQVLRILPAGCAVAGTGAEEGRASRGQWPPQFQCPI